jgi:hypothetical protein
MKTYVVKITDTDGMFCEITTEAVNPTVAVAEATDLVNDASIFPWDVAEVTCRVVSKPAPVGWDRIEA